jgi:hypothetical protein
MSKSKHTPGPWYITEGRQPRIYPDNSDSISKECVAIVYDGCEEEEMQANARLIAAAPDLYKAAVAALGNITGGSLAPFVDGMELLRLLKAAIAKAEVEPCE